MLQTWAPTTAATMTCRRCSRTRAAPAHRVTTWDGSRGKKVGGRAALSPERPRRSRRCMWRPGTLRFTLSPLPLVRRVVQVRRWQGQRGVSGGYPATVWRRGLAYSICSTVRPPPAGSTWRVARPQHPTHASKIAISKHCLHPCAVKPVSLKNLMTLTFVFVINANAYKILSKYSTDVSFGGKQRREMVGGSLDWTLDRGFQVWLCSFIKCFIHIVYF